MSRLTNRCVPIALVLGALAGCSSSPTGYAAKYTDQGRLLLDGPVSRMTQSAIVADAADQVPLLYQFAVQAGKIRAPVPSGGGPTTIVFPAQTLRDQQIALLTVAGQDWPDVILVGEGYIDRQCQAFITALDDLERSKKTTLADMNAVQGATVGIMGLAIAAQKAIGIVGISFGLAANLFDTTTSTVLYQLPATGVSTIVEAQRQFLRLNETGALAGVTSQGLAAARLGTYVQYCAPVTIEANIGKVLGNAKGTAAGIETNPTQPVVTSTVLPTIVHSAAYSPTLTTRNALRQQIDALNADQIKALAAAMEPYLPSAEDTVKQYATAYNPGGGPLANSPYARQILETWVTTSDNVGLLPTWSNALNSVQGR